MAVDPKDRQPRAKSAPTKEIKLGGDPNRFETETIGWHFHRLDGSHEKWGWDKLKASQWKAILAHLKSFEGLTWAELKKQAGGRKQGTNHHSLDVNGFNKAARDRLKQLKLDDYDTLFSLRINNTLRLYGVRDGRVLQLLWHDPYHGTGSGCYPTKNR